MLRAALKDRPQDWRETPEAREVEEEAWRQ